MSTAKYERLKNTAKEHYDDHNMCAVIAIALFCDVSYGKAHAALARAGRKNRKRTAPEQIIAALKELLDEELQTAPADGFTVAKAALQVPYARALLFTSGHICAMIDGVVHDWTQGRRHRVVSAITMDIHPPMPLRST